jgi:hypothetical protein
MFDKRRRGHMRENLRDKMVGVGIALIVVPVGAALFADYSWTEAAIGVAIGAAIIAWIRPGRPRRRHVAWVARIEPDPADVAAGKGSFEPYYVPTCECGWDDQYYDDPEAARRAAEKHAERVESGQRREFMPVED